MPNGGPNDPPDAIGVHIGAEADKVLLQKIAVNNLDAFDEEIKISDESGNAFIVPEHKKKHHGKHK